METLRRPMLQAMLLSAVVLATCVAVWAQDEHKVTNVVIYTPESNDVFPVGSTVHFSACVTGDGDTEFNYTWQTNNPHYEKTGKSRCIYNGGIWVHYLSWDQQITTTGEIQVHLTATAGSQIPQDDMATFRMVDLALASATVEAAWDGTPNTRTTIGIGERVNCTATLTPAAPGVTVNWTATQGTVAPTAGLTTVLSAPLAAADTTLTVTATVAGLETGSLTKSKTFQAIKPAGMEHRHTTTPHPPYGDFPPGTLGPPYNWMGCETVFQAVTTPTSVAFTNVDMREDRVTPIVFDWPDHTHVNWAVAQYVGPVKIGLQGNPDTCADGFNAPCARLNGPTQDPFGWEWEITMQFQDGGGGWHDFQPTMHYFRYRLAPVLGAAMAGVLSGGTAEGDWQGPFQ